MPAPTSMLYISGLLLSLLVIAIAGSSLRRKRAAKGRPTQE